MWFKVVALKNCKMQFIKLVTLNHGKMWQLKYYYKRFFIQHPLEVCYAQIIYLF
jgi:hypothetical protein